VPSATCVPQCRETDFTIWLTKRQPTHWLASSGRPFDPTDGFFRDGSGFDPGNVPPTETPFLGELKCIEIDPVTGDPVTGNHLKGEATIKTISGTNEGDVSKYNAIGIAGNSDATPSNPLLLDNNVYNACPGKLIVNHFATNAEDPVASDVSGVSSSSVSTELTLVPCNEDFENQKNTNVTAKFVIFNELEQRFSASTSLSCFLNIELSAIDDPNGTGRSVFSKAGLGTDVAHTEITPVKSNVDGSLHALVGVVERTTSVSADGDTVASRAAYDLFTSGSLLPTCDTTTNTCVGASSVSCGADTDCPPDQIALPQE
jgi:hypothetical protein